MYVVLRDRVGLEPLRKDGKAADKPGGAESGDVVAPAAVAGEHVAAGITYDEVRSDGGFTDPRLTDNQHTLFRAVAAPFLDLLEDPLAAAERVLTFGAEQVKGRAQ